jgi:peptidoglycan LD-endopeptidase LytH
MNRLWWIIIPLGLIIGIGLYFLVLHKPADFSRSIRVGEWLHDPTAHPDWSMKAGQQCGNAPFQFPTDGFIGFLWDDSFKVGHRHQGIDIFSGSEPNVTPVYAVYDGYLTRLVEWKSSIILRIPDDPLQPGRQIWTYYTHMADPLGSSFIAVEFPPGTHEVFVNAGTLLGFQGDYSGDPNNPVGVHLHFSIVLDNGQGNFRNELEITNTLDPSPYFNIALNANTANDGIPRCSDFTQGQQP